MADHSKPSQTSEKRSTRKTVQLTPEEALQILQESFRIVEEAGIGITVERTNIGTLVTLAGVAYIDNNLICANIGTSGAV